MKRLRILRRWFKRRFGYARLLCVGLLIGFAALRVADPAPIEEFRVRTFDTFQVLDPRVKTAKPVRIVNIDEKSLAKFGQWPWPRTRVADLVTNLTRLGAVAIAFRHHVRGARPAQSRRCRRYDSQPRRRDPDQTARVAEQ